MHKNVINGKLPFKLVQLVTSSQAVFGIHFLATQNLKKKQRQVGNDG